MEDRKSNKPDPENTGAEGVRAPVKGGSSSGEFVPSGSGQNRGPEPSEEELLSGATMAGGSITPTPSSTRARRSQMYQKPAGLQPGDVLGERFEILSILGEGGMGTVYKAIDREVDQVIALKLIRPQMADHPAILALQTRTVDGTAGHPQKRDSHSRFVRS